MILRKEIVERLKGRLDIKRQLRKILDVPNTTLWRWIEENKPNGPLTTFGALTAISKGLDLDVLDDLVTDQYEPADQERELCDEPALPGQNG